MQNSNSYLAQESLYNLQSCPGTGESSYAWELRREHSKLRSLRSSCASSEEYLSNRFHSRQWEYSFPTPHRGFSADPPNLPCHWTYLARWCACKWKRSATREALRKFSEAHSASNTNRWRSSRLHYEESKSPHATRRTPRESPSQATCSYPWWFSSKWAHCWQCLFQHHRTQFFWGLLAPLSWLAQYLASFQGSFVALRNGCSAVDQRKSWSNDRLTSSLTGWFLQQYAWKFVSSASHLNSCSRLIQSIPSLAQHFSSPFYSLCRRKASDRHFCWTT